MNKMISFAKIMFAGLGIYLLIVIARSMLSLLTFIFNDFRWDSLVLIIVSICVSLAMVVAIIQLLFIRRDNLARKLIAKDIEADEPQNIELTLTMAFRLVSVGAGLFCLSSFVWRASHTIMSIIMAMKFELPDDQIYQMISRGISVDFIQPVVYLGLAVYLLCGSPHFVRWQVKKTLQLCD